MKIWEQITPKTWCKRVWAKSATGRSVDCYSSMAVKWCAYGWLERIYGYSSEEFVGRFRASIEDTSISAWNDHPERTFSEVQAAFKKADL